MISALKYSPASYVTPYVKKESGESGPQTTESPKKDESKKKEVIAKLEARDAEVRAHEAAHMAAGGGVAGGASFDYQIGPNGKAYAVGGEVPIDISAESDPGATQTKMQKVRAAALAPASPSPQDIKVAATASMIEMKAKMDELKEKGENAKEGIKKVALQRYDEAQTIGES